MSLEISLERRAALRRLTLLALAIGAMFGLATLVLGHSLEEVRGTVLSFGSLAPVLFVLVWVAATPALFPGTVLGALGGVLFGTGLGLALSLVGATIGAIVSFLIARRFGHDAAQRLTGARVARLHERIERNGFRAVVLARAAPGVPASLLYFAAGLSRVRVRAFAAGVLVGGAPRVFSYSALGGSAGDPRSPAAIAAFVLIVLPPVTLALFAVARRVARLRAAHR